MKKAFFILVQLTGMAIYCRGQQSEFIASGKVKDSRTGKGVVARVKYRSMPTGSIHGEFRDSTFSFQIFGTARYEVTAEAEGYNPRTVLADPGFLDSEQKLTLDISLLPKGETIRLQHLIFPQGISEIDSASFDELDAVAQMMQSNPKMVIQLEGHTDNAGSPKANLSLSEKRVEAVKKYLVSNGIAKSRVKTKAFGGSKPLRNEMTEEAKALNRRVEVRILKD